MDKAIAKKLGNIINNWKLPGDQMVRRRKLEICLVMATDAMEDARSHLGARSPKVQAAYNVLDNTLKRMEK